MPNDINSIISQIMTLKQQGATPQAVMQMMMQQNPQMQMAQTRLKNMANGKNPQEFVMQLAKQQGVNPEMMQGIMSLFGRI